MIPISLLLRAPAPHRQRREAGGKEKGRGGFGDGNELVGHGHGSLGNSRHRVDRTEAAGRAEEGLNDRRHVNVEGTQTDVDPAEPVNDFETPVGWI